MVLDWDTILSGRKGICEWREECEEIEDCQISRAGYRHSRPELTTEHRTHYRTQNSPQNTELTTEHRTHYRTQNSLQNRTHYRTQNSPQNTELTTEYKTTLYREPFQFFNDFQPIKELCLTDGFGCIQQSA